MVITVFTLLKLYEEIGSVLQEQASLTNTHKVFVNFLTRI
jgi:hypothetical protein